MNLPIKIDSELVKNLTEPMTKIIEVVSNAIGTLYEPTKIKRKAKADAQGKIYKTIGDLVSNELEERGLKNYIHQIGKKQFNLEQIVEKALMQQLTIDTSEDNENVDVSETEHFLNKTFDKKTPDDGWLMDFFDLCQNTSNDEIQEIWAALLRSEIAKPGLVSRRLMHTIKILAQKEAQTFQRMSRCYSQVLMGTHEIYEKNSTEEPTSFFGTISVVGDLEIYENKEGEEIFGFNHVSITLLEEIGLVTRQQFYSDHNDAREVTFGDNSMLYLENAEFEMCHFTGLGLELFELSKSNHDKLYLEVIKKEFQEQKMIRNTTENKRR